MAKHTSGPWNLQPVGSGHRIIGGPKKQILADVYATAGRVSAGNGKIMTGALQMFEALKIAKKEIDDLVNTMEVLGAEDPPYETQRIINAAILAADPEVE